MNFIEIALDEAIKAAEEGNVPIGCVIVRNNKILASTHNTKNTTHIAINHAEILAIKEACEKIGSWYLNDCELYVTLEPCDMCTAAIAEARINKVYYLLESNYIDNSNKNISKVRFEKIKCNSKYGDIISNFFKDLR